MQALAEKLVLERLLNSWVLTYISPFLYLLNGPLRDFIEEVLVFLIPHLRGNCNGLDFE